ncbi:MAG: hypothetical protein RL681_406 [Candidatus Parcubacteria bacterium]|jgi:hypothetical protein
MELLAFVLVWPFLILALGLVGIAAWSWSGAFLTLPWLWAFILIILVWIVFLGRARNIGQGKSSIEQLALVRRGVIAISIAALLPTFARYAVQSLHTSLPGVIFALIFGFWMMLWGMMMRDRRMLMYGNIIGGAFTVLYAYSWLWELGEFSRIFATAFGLAAAVGIAFFKLKDKLTS